MTMEIGHQVAEGQARRKSCRGILKLLVLLALVGGLVIAAIFLPVKDYFLTALEWTRQLGPWGPVAVAAFYVVACVLFLPGSLLTLGAGFLFGVVSGTITVSVGSVLGACAAFLVGRTVARDWIAARISGNAKFAAIDEAVGRQGFKIVLLTRLSPVFPFNMLNYGYGLTKVRFRTYALASWIGMIPGTIMYVYIGSTFGSLAEVAAGGKQKTLAEWIFLGVGLAITVLVTMFVTRVARRALKQAVGTGQETGQTAGA